MTFLGGCLLFEKVSLNPSARRVLQILAVVILMLALAALRILFSYYRRPVMSGIGGNDEYLMLVYSDLPEYFRAEKPDSLLKYLSFPWFLNIPSWTGLPFWVVMALLWVLAAISVYFCIRKVSGCWFALFCFAFVLFSPQGFDSQIGVRIYRNMIITPCFYILFSAMAALILDFWSGKKRFSWLSLLLEALGLSLIFPFVYFIKEDSFWMPLLLVLLMAGEAGGLLWSVIRDRKEKISRLALRILFSALVILMPLTVFQIQSQRYLDANEKAFDYCEYTLRTNGETAGFLRRVYQIDSENRTIVHWAPRDALEKAIAASPTLKSNPKLVRQILYSVWTNEGESEIAGDFLSWIMITAYQNVEELNTASKADAYMKKVNAELDEAFENGTLEKSDEFQLTSSAGGRSWEEVGELFEPLLTMYRTMILLHGYQSSPDLPKDAPDRTDPYEEKLGMEISYPKTEKDLEDLEEILQTGSEIAEADFDVYRVMIPVLLLTGVSGWLAGLVLLLRRWKMPLIMKADMVLIFLLTGLSIGYSLGIVWFSQFLFYDSSYWRELTILVYYGSGASAMFYTAFLLAVPLWKQVFLFRKSRSLQQDPPSSEDQ